LGVYYDLFACEGESSVVFNLSVITGKKRTGSVTVEIVYFSRGMFNFKVHLHLITVMWPCGHNQRTIVVRMWEGG
jgi:hypothetical protein